MKSYSLVAVLALGSAFSRPVDAAEGTFDSNGVKIRYVTEGKGEAVVLIHGWMGDSSMWGRDWAGNTKLKSAKGFQAIAIDCRGHGKSDKPHDANKYGVELAADVVRLLDHLKIEKAHLIGYSSGAFIAGNVAATHPDRVLSIIYGGQAPLVKGTGSKTSTGPSETEIFAKAVDEGKGLGPYISAVWPSSKPKLSEEQANQIAKFLYTGKDVKAYALAGLSFKGLNVTGEQLKRCKAPVLFIHGSIENEDTIYRVAAVQKLLGHCEVKVVEGADHITTLARPEFGAEIEKFLFANKQK